MYQTIRQETEEDLRFINKKYNRWRLGPSMPARYLGYALVLYAVYALFMVYLHIRLFQTGTVVYVELFVFRLITGILALLLSFGKLNACILKLRLLIFKNTCNSIQKLTFDQESFTVEENGREKLYYYSDVVQWDIYTPQVTFQTKYRCFLIRPEHLQAGNWPEFLDFMKKRKAFGEKEAIRRRKVV